MYNRPEVATDSVHCNLWRLSSAHLAICLFDTPFPEIGRQAARDADKSWKGSLFRRRRVLVQPFNQQSRELIVSPKAAEDGPGDITKDPLIRDGL